MFVGPSHPLFSDRLNPLASGRLGGAPRWGGDGFLPHMGAPPGARFDPVSPFPPYGPGGGSVGPTRNFGPGGGGGAAGPDNDDFPPPGFNDMYS